MILNVYSNLKMKKILIGFDYILTNCGIAQLCLKLLQLDLAYQSLFGLAISEIELQFKDKIDIVSLQALNHFQKLDQKYF